MMKEKEWKQVKTEEKNATEKQKRKEEVKEFNKMNKELINNKS